MAVPHPYALGAVLLVVLQLCIANHAVFAAVYPKMSQTTRLSVISEDSLTEDELLLFESIEGIMAVVKEPSLYRVSGSVNSSTDSYAVWLHEMATYYNVSYIVTDALPWLKAVVPLYANGTVLCTLNSNSTTAAIAYSTAMLHTGGQRLVISTTATQPMLSALGLSVYRDLRSDNDMEAFYTEIGIDTFSSQTLVIQSPDKSSFLTSYAIYANAAIAYPLQWTTNLSSTVLGRMEKGSSAMFGWGSDEYNTVSALSQAETWVHAADFAKNLPSLTNAIPANAVQSVESSFTPRRSSVLRRNDDGSSAVHTVSFLMTDGDNIQWVLGGFSTDAKWFGSPERGKVPIGWSLSAALQQISPPTFSYLKRSLTANDEFVAASSGAGYTYPDDWEAPGLQRMANLTNGFMKDQGMTTLNVIGNKPTTESMKPFMLQSTIDGILYYEFSDYSGLHGKIEFIEGKPLIGGRYNLWSPQFESVDSLVEKLVKLPKDPSSSSGYSLIPVHVWSHTTADVVEVCDKLNAAGGFEVLLPTDFVRKVSSNLQT